MRQGTPNVMRMIASVAHGELRAKGSTKALTPHDCRSGVMLVCKGFQCQIAQAAGRDEVDKKPCLLNWINGNSLACWQVQRGVF
ncbi:hypothetical protein EYF80_023487 [Liparis tanakae]|uniref:Uncharacterized protein n=1 Tax=Liparis tanakae TaxID=230148 RepID=A0A4Z2HMQ3_9TELE|nr:hypothetical protein EYF80_023487 [Liparis tanakae]